MKCMSLRSPPSPNLNNTGQSMENPKRPQILKGALVQFGRNLPQQGRTVAFQYNPESLRRTLEPAGAGEAPKEIIRFTLTLDTTTALETPGQEPAAVASGLLPALAALELLLYQGEGHDPPKRPGASSSFCLFVWGAERVVPVRVVQLEIREQMFDIHLHPIRAEADLSLEVLSEAILSKIPRARKYMSEYMKTKQSLAQAAYLNRPLKDLLMPL
jgi:hypothetical protein